MKDYFPHSMFYGCVIRIFRRLQVNDKLEYAA